MDQKEAVPKGSDMEIKEQQQPLDDRAEVNQEQKETIKSPKKVKMENLQEIDRPQSPPVGTNFNFILDIPLQITVELGKTRMTIRDLLQLGQGSVIGLSKLAGEPIEVLVHQKLIARGEVVRVNEKLGVRLTDLITPQERIEKLR